MTYKVLDLFSGIGGFSLGLERTGGFKTVAFCEIEEYPRKVLKKHWPDVPIFEDVRNVSRQQLDAAGISCDVITGGFPCQDISIAGKQAGIEAERSGLWSELCRIIGDARPAYAIMENVSALISGDNGQWFGKVLGDLAEIGYDCEWHCIPASELGAHHHRDRVWIIAYPSKVGCGYGCDHRQERYLQADEEWGTAEIQQQRHQWQHRTGKIRSILADSPGVHVQGLMYRSWAEQLGRSGGWSTEPDVGRVANGVPRRVDRLKCLGNAVVPQIPELIGRAILEAEYAKTQKV